MQLNRISESTVESMNRNYDCECLQVTADNMESGEYFRLLRYGDDEQWIFAQNDRIQEPFGIVHIMTEISNRFGGISSMIAQQ